MKQLVIGILAHVDSGKTTLSEAMLYRSGEIRKLGRVDHGDAFLDSHELERSRGITIFSKQAVMSLEHTQITLLDTPGHVDFSTEMERTLQVLDYAVLVISGTDGIQSHTETLWKLLQHYHIPTFLYINKMDLAGADRDALMQQLKSKLHEGCVNFTDEPWAEHLWENVALCDEFLMDEFLDTGSIQIERIQHAIARRSVFPCYFGSALKLNGVDDLLLGLDRYTRSPSYHESFGAKVFKIATDEQGSRLTYLKITGGSLKVKDTLTDVDENEKTRAEKVNQIRIYSGAKFKTADEVFAGTVCAVTGLTQTFPGQGFGAEAQSDLPMLEPVLTYRVELPAEMDVHTALSNLRLLEEEEPQLHVIWNERLQELHIQLMGEVQLEILKSLISERFGMHVNFGQGNIVYKETISAPVEGVGHFEPLRHYAEVHLLMEPGEPGSGLQFSTACREDDLDKNWQRLILTHLEERTHVGVLTGSPITDMKITLIAGRAHLKHTEGGDFRQATYRAVRQGLKCAQSVLLEPVYTFRLQIPSESVGRAMSDLQRMKGVFEPPIVKEEDAVLTGTVPVATMRDYQTEVTQYTRGRGRLTCTLKGYEPCHNTQEVIDAIGYDSDADLDHPADSVFCAHGAGFVVKWDQVREHMHVDSGRREKSDEEMPAVPEYRVARASYASTLEEDKELLKIFEKTYGPIRQDPRIGFQSTRSESTVPAYGIAEKLPSGPEYLLVDGYNIIFAWDDLKVLAQEDLDTARQRLIHTLCNYRGFCPCELILVFDAYKVKGNPGEIEQINNIHVVYTKEAETADMYIEKVTHQIARKHRVRVATSDGLEQMIILGHGAFRISARAFREEVDRMEQAIAKYVTSAKL